MFCIFCEKEVPSAEHGCEIALKMLRAKYPADIKDASGEGGLINAENMSNEELNECADLMEAAATKGTVHGTGPQVQNLPKNVEIIADIFPRDFMGYILDRLLNDNPRDRRFLIATTDAGRKQTIHGPIDVFMRYYECWIVDNKNGYLPRY